MMPPTAQQASPMEHQLSLALFLKMPMMKHASAISQRIVTITV
jgi:hypothetical protein